MRTRAFCFLWLVGAPALCCPLAVGGVNHRFAEIRWCTASNSLRLPSVRNHTLVQQIPFGSSRLFWLRWLNCSMTSRAKSASVVLLRANFAPAVPSCPRGLFLVFSFSCPVAMLKLRGAVNNASDSWVSPFAQGVPTFQNQTFWASAPFDENDCDDGEYFVSHRSTCGSQLSERKTRWVKRTFCLLSAWHKITFPASNMQRKRLSAFDRKPLTHEQRHPNLTEKVLSQQLWQLSWTFRFQFGWTCALCGRLHSFNITIQFASTTFLKTGISWRRAGRRDFPFSIHSSRNRRQNNRVVQQLQSRLTEIDHKFDIIAWRKWFQCENLAICRIQLVT